MSLKVFVNGALVPKEEAMVSVFDHGLLYGDGVFEGIRAYRGRVFRFDEHLKRLYDSARAIRLTIPIGIEEMRGVVLDTLIANGLKDAYIRLVVTRGVGDLGLDPDKCAHPSIFVITDKITLYPEEYYRNGLAIATVPTRRNIPEAINPRIKSLNYLNNVLAKIEAKGRGVIEAIMLNQDGFVAECTGDNLFSYAEGVLRTPSTACGALKGITREVIIEIAAELKIPVKETRLTRFDLYTAEEIFLTGTAAEVIPVVEVDGRTIGSGSPGTVTKKIIRKFRSLTGRTGTPIRSARRKKKR